MTPEPNLSSLAEACAKEIHTQMELDCANIGVVMRKTPRSLGLMSAIILKHLQPLAKDRERLDWLESKSKYIISTTGAHRGYHELPSVAVDYWAGKSGVTAGLGMTPATLRTAIDSALAPKPASSS